MATTVDRMKVRAGPSGRGENVGDRLKRLVHPCPGRFTERVGRHETGADCVVVRPSHECPMLLGPDAEKPERHQGVRTSVARSAVADYPLTPRAFERDPVQAYPLTQSALARTSVVDLRFRIVLNIKAEVKAET